VPTFEDWPHLPYTWAYCREAFRWRPVSSGGFQHATADDLVWVRAIVDSSMYPSDGRS
jgi:hypothetical protein